MTTAELSTAEIADPRIDPDALTEFVDDVRVELLPLGAYGTWIAFNLAAEIQQFAKACGLGRGVAEMLFRIRSSPNLQRRPDVAFVSFESWPRGKRPPSTNAWEVVPELVVKVVSPTNYAEEIPTKIREYFEAGVRRAWVIYTHEALIYDYESSRLIRVLGEGDALDGGEILPGFRLPLADLFEGRDEAGPIAG